MAIDALIKWLFLEISFDKEYKSTFVHGYLLIQGSIVSKISLYRGSLMWLHEMQIPRLFIQMVKDDGYTIDLYNRPGEVKRISANRIPLRFIVRIAILVFTIITCLWFYPGILYTYISNKPKQLPWSRVSSLLCQMLYSITLISNERRVTFTIDSDHWSTNFDVIDMSRTTSLIIAFDQQCCISTFLLAKIKHIGKIEKFEIWLGNF